MADKQQKKGRNPYADTGLMIAVAMLIVMVIKSLIFGVTWESIFWFVIAIAYCVVSYKYDSQSKTIKHTTTGFIVLSIIAAFAIAIIDRKPQPKMHAFEQAAKDTTASEEEFILKPEPELPALEKETTTSHDTINTTIETTEENQEELQSEQQEPSTDAEMVEEAI